MARPVDAADINMTVGRTMEASRGLRGMEVRELTAAMGMEASTYHKRKSGRTAWSVVDAQRAADVLGVNVAILFRGLDLGPASSFVAGAGFEPATSGLRARELVSA